MTRGRPPKPIERARATARNATHKADGRPLPAARGTIVKTTDTPAPPAGLGERGLREWESIWSAGASWLAPAQDYPWVEIVCRAWDDIEHFRARVQRDGPIAQGSMGQVIAHPLIASIRQSEAHIMKALSTLGFSPTDRARLGLAEVKVRSKLQDMMAKSG